MIFFDEKLYQKCKKELNSRGAQNIVQQYRRECKIKKGYKPTFLSYFYSPVLTVLKQHFKNLKNKRILEIGYRMPLFLDYLKLNGANSYGIDIEPYITNKNLFKMSIEKLTPSFKRKFTDFFHAIIERLTLSRQYEEEYFLEKGRHRFKNKKLILYNLHHLLKPGGILVLQDDRGSIFTESEFKRAGFRKIMKERPIVFREKGKYLGWNTLVVYKKGLK